LTKIKSNSPYTLLLTGGTGTFGEEFLRIILKDKKLKKIIIFSRDEMKQWHMRNKYSDNRIRFFIGDVRDEARLNMALKNVDFVFHAAAMKIVETAEYNPFECVQTNVNGAMNLIKACIYNKVKKIIALSTDKASSPTNLYGASKLISDKIFLTANSQVGNQKTLFSIVRYGNVIGSRGSLIPYLLKLDKEKKPYFPITHEKMTRFIISINDAVKFCIMSMNLMRGSEIFVKKLPSVRIIDIAKAINLKKKIKFIGQRVGEKLSEELIGEEDSLNAQEFKNYFVIRTQDNIIKKKNKTFFSYTSENNRQFLSIKEIKKIIKNLDQNN
jgi:UDP-N-acetylglucosamine 4,6-dehydratase (inverting)